MAGGIFLQKIECSRKVDKSGRKNAWNFFLVSLGLGGKGF